MYSKLEQDRSFARTGMPRALEVESGGWIGFKYEIECELKQKYTFFAYFNGSRYRVMVVSPEVERGELGHESHVLPDGSLCLEPTVQGCRTLQAAYTKSVLWANGYSIYAQTGKFPFSANN